MEFTAQEIHYIGMNFIGKELQNRGYEFLAVNSNPKKHPQFVTYKKNEANILVMVKTVVYPKDFGQIPSISTKVIEKATEQNAKVWFAGVGLANVNDHALPLSKKEDYAILFNNFKEIYHG